MYRTIMVPLDGSNFSERALPMALAVARRDGAALHLVHVSGLLTPAPHVSGDPVSDSVFDTDVREDMARYLESVRKQVAETTRIDITTDVIEGAPGVALPLHAVVRGADLVVMATHGRGGINRTWLGSVAEAMVRAVRVPVLLTRPDEDSPADLNEHVTVKQILVPLHDSAFSTAILLHGENLAAVFNSSLALTNVVTPMEIHARTITAPVLDVDERKLEADRARAADFLDRTAMLAGINGRPITTHLLVASQIATAIIELAEKVDADIIAMSTHARSGVGRMLLGSVADKVVRGTTRAVLLYRPE